MSKNNKKKKSVQKKQSRVYKNAYLYQENETQETELSVTKQQKFNFEDSLVEDELDSSFLDKRKRYKSPKNVVEKKIYPKKTIFFLSFLLFVSLLFTGSHFLFTNHNKVRIVTKVVSKEVVPENIVFLGDSITDYYDLKKYYTNYHVVNSGVSGNKTVDILENLEERVYQYNPSKIFLLIGTNDLEIKRSKEEILDNIKQIIEKISENRKRTEIFVEGIYPVNKDLNEELVNNRDNETIQAINKELKKYCDSKKITYIDTYKKLQDEDGNLKETYTDDGLHLNEEGYEVITSYLKPYVSKKEK